jgi:hypothetical protein
MTQSIQPAFSTDDDNNVFKAAKVTQNGVGALTYIIDNKRVMIDYLEQYMLSDKVVEEVKDLNSLNDETDFILDCFTVGVL